jgi:tetratricopeptide (TPR) repeat protein
MNKENILFGIIGLLAGAIIGFMATNYVNRNAMNTNNSPAKPSMMGQQTQPSDGGQAAMPAVKEALDKADKEPDNFEAQIGAAQMFARINNFEKAIPYFEKANKLKPDDFDTLVSLGNANFDFKKWDDAQKWYEKALAVKADDVSVRTDLGITFVERDNPDYDRAIKEFETALKTKADNQPTIFNLAIAYFKKGDTQKAQDFRKKITDSELSGRLDKFFAEK